MNRFCKSLELSDYEISDSFQHIRNMMAVFSAAKAPYPFGHEHRVWEYGMALTAIRQRETQTVLEVGGGASLFAAAAEWIGMDVLQLDPGHWEPTFDRQRQQTGLKLPWKKLHLNDFDPNATFDAVTCLSVIEHVPTEEGRHTFFRQLCQHVAPKGLLILTTDFHPSGQNMTAGHETSFSPKMLLDLIAIGKDEGLKVYGEKPDYSHFEPLVFDQYSFAMVALERK